MKVKILALLLSIKFLPTILLLAILPSLIMLGVAKCTRAASLSAPAARPEAGGDGLGVRYAANFNIEYLADSVKLVTDSDGNSLLLVPRGTPVPSAYADAPMLEAPISSAMFTSTTFVALLGALENDSLYDAVSIVTIPESHWTTEQILQGFRNGRTHFVEHGFTSLANIEEIIRIRPQIVFTGGGDIYDMQLRSLLNEAGIKHLTLLEWTEETDAAYLEWIKFFAAFFNLDEEAERIFQVKIARLNELYAKAAGVPNRPSVAYAHIWDGLVHTQAGSSTLARQIERAGASYALSDLEGSGSITISMEEFFIRCRDADIIIYATLPQYCPDKSFLLGIEPLMAEFAAFKNDRIYIFDQGYYMNSDKAVEKFEDMVFMFQSDLLGGHNLLMYQKLPD
ncbi:MAG: ABC transporter substrate-binding protein [Treponema sp.]|nr:ABC transporter substrate-binding protein [Treponema sp.]